MLMHTNAVAVLAVGLTTPFYKGRWQPPLGWFISTQTKLVCIVLTFHLSWQSFDALMEAPISAVVKYWMIQKVYPVWRTSKALKYVNFMKIFPHKVRTKCAKLSSEDIWIHIDKYFWIDVKDFSFNNMEKSQNKPANFAQLHQNHMI